MRSTVFIAFLLAFVVARCAEPAPEPAAESDVIEWISYTSEEMGVTLEHPSTFDSVEEEDSEIGTGTGAIAVRSLRLYPGFGGEAPSIHIDRTNDERILEWVTSDYPLETRRMYHTTLSHFHWDGMGDVTGYVFRSKEDVIVISFTFIYDNWDIRYILQSLTIDGNPVIQ